MALAAWAIATLIVRATGSIIGGAVAVALLMLNPNVLYLQSTPMTEPLLFGTMFLAVALVAEWCGQPSVSAKATTDMTHAASRPCFGETAARCSSTRAAGPALVAAILTRFEAWPVVAALVVLAFVVLMRSGVTVGNALRRVRGLALWPMWAVLGFMMNSKV